jgi:hypothetical protein
MTHHPYTYVTVTVEPGAAPTVTISYYTGELQASAQVTTGERPYLSLHAPEGSVTISTTGAGRVTDQDLKVARQLVEASTRYLTDCERLHAAQRDQADQADSCETAA